MADIVILDGFHAGETIGLSDEVCIGRAGGSSEEHQGGIYLHDDEISRQHARVFKQGDSYLIQDLNSTNGTSLKGELIKPGVDYPLHDGDEIQISSTRLIFIDSIESSQASQVAINDSQTHDFDLGSSQYLDGDSSISLQMLSDEPFDPNMSIMLDASQLMEELARHEKAEANSAQQTMRHLQAVLKVSTALAAVTSREELMARVIDSIFETFSHADRAFVILKDQKTNQLIPLALRTRLKNEREAKRISVSSSIIKEVLEHKHSILLMDAMGDKRFSSQESVISLAIRSVMCVPLLFKDEVLGLIQVDTSTGPRKFSEEDLQILTAISTQVAISMKNSQLYRDIEQLFEGFVSASVQAIEARDPATAGHSFRVADLTVKLATAVDSSSERSLKQISFNSEQIQELRYAALLHDFGKVGVRENVLTKAKKLYPHDIRLLQQRFEYAKACIERQAYAELIAMHEKMHFGSQEFLKHKHLVRKKVSSENAKLDKYMDAILHTNEPIISYGETPAALDEMMNYRFRGNNNEEIALLNMFEFSTLTLSQGSLNPEERVEIETHVNHTYNFLKLIPWKGNLSKVADIAYAHHEKLDGSGYPNGLVSEQIPIQAKIMTIVDIYDALVSGDRPYREEVPSTRALDILQDQVNSGKLDKDLFRIFIEAEIYR